jgi:serine/threonine-protein kinase
VAERNNRRLLLLSPVVLAGHAIHVAVFHPSATDRATMAPDVLRWRETVAWMHAATFVVTLGLAVSILLWGRTRPGRWLAPAAVLTYLLHGAAIAGADQISTASGVAPFIGFCIFMGVVITMSPWMAGAVYGIGCGAFIAAIVAMQPSRALRLALLPNGVSIVFASVVLAWALYAARRRDFAGQATIQKQRVVLAELNASLERRVQEQVSEIVRRAEEVERLNAQLQAQVRERSSELSVALEKLAARRDSDESLRRGAVLGDRFEIVEPLGEGGMGVVYAGIDRTTGSRVAIKVIQARSSSQLDALHRFLREARAAATVAHPAIVRMLAVDVSRDGMLFQAQDLVVGETLGHAMQRRGAFEAGPAARLGAVLCDALAGAHAQGVVHRDVKPSNVMLTRQAPGLKLLDFGIAKLFEAPAAHASALGMSGTGTGLGAIMGTPAYMAPEQIQGDREVTAKADVYAVGVLLFELVAGRPPFDQTTLWGIAYSHMCVEPPDLRALSPAVPAKLSDVVARCLAKEPGDRPTAQQVSAALSACADELGAAPLEQLEAGAPVARSMAEAG